MSRSQGFMVVRTARKAHDCDSCYGVIQPGARYCRWSMPPWGEANESPNWWTALTHPRDEQAQCVVETPSG